MRARTGGRINTVSRMPTPERKARLLLNDTNRQIAMTIQAFDILRAVPESNSRILAKTFCELTLISVLARP
jgi:hypothetical protein